MLKIFGVIVYVATYIGTFTVSNEIDSVVKILTPEALSDEVFKFRALIRFELWMSSSSFMAKSVYVMFRFCCYPELI